MGQSKLTLQVLSAYLPYGVKMILLENNREVDLSPGFVNPVLCYPSHYKLLLRPLSALTTEIEYNGERFVPMLMLVDPDKTDWGKMKAVQYNPFKGIWPDKIYYKVEHSELGEVITINPLNPLVLPYHLVQKLLEWHFDLFGLLDSGDALPITAPPSVNGDEK